MKKVENSTNVKSSLLTDFERMRQFPRAVWVLVVGSFVNRLGTFVLPYLALYLTHKGFGVTAIGYALAAWSLGGLLATVIGGHLADTLGRRATVVLSMLSSAVLLFALSFVQPLWGIVIIAFFSAMSAEIYRPAGHALVADLTSDEDRVLVYAVIRWAINAGFAIGPAIAGVLTQFNYQYIFWFDGLTSAIYGVLAICFLPKVENYEKPPASYIFKAFSSLKKSFGVSFSDPAFIQVFLASFLTAYGFFQTVITLGVDVTNRGFDEVMFGVILGVNGMMIVFIELPLSVWVRRQSQRTMLILGYTLIGIGFGMFVWTTGLVPLFLGMIVLTFGEMIALPVAMAYISKLAPDDMRGRYMGMWGFSWALALLVATSTSLNLFEKMGNQFWLLIFGICLTGAAIMAVNFKSMKPIRN